MNENKNIELGIKKELLLNKEINNFEEDIIGIKSYVKSLERAIDDGAQIISVSSKYGGGKSSICRNLIRNPKYGKKSIISLWETIIEQDEEPEKNKTNMIDVNENINIINLYKSFLYQLAGNFKDRRYAKYISKKLNKSNGIIGIYFKEKRSILYLCIALLCAAVGYLAEGIDAIEWNFLYWLQEITNISVNLTFLKYLFLFISIVFIILAVVRGGVVFATQKSENNRLLTLNDMFSLYTDIVCESSDENKKNIIIIEDIDRCNNLDIAYYFIKSIIKLIHLDYNDEVSRKKLENTVLIICMDESKFLEFSNNPEEFLKIFHYKLDVGEINFEDFIGTFKEIVKNLNILPEEKLELECLLYEPNNSIRLIKNAINDCMLKRSVLIERFSERTIINFKGCIAYSLLKNYYNKEFNKFINDDNAIEFVTCCLDNKYNDKKMTVITGNSGDFLEKVNELVKKGFIDDNFRLYLYNFPKYEVVKSPYEVNFWNYIENGNKLDIHNNSNLQIDVIQNIANTVNNRGIEYPGNINNDVYVFNILLRNNNDKQLEKFISKKINLTNDMFAKETKKFLKDCIIKKVDFELLKGFLLKVIDKEWCKSIKVDNKKFYEFRLLLTEIMKNDINQVNFLFMNDFISITLEEFNFLVNKELAYSLINFSNFTEDLEVIIPKILDKISESEKIKSLIYWSKNSIDKESCVNHCVDFLLEYKQYQKEILKFLSENQSLLEKNVKFSNYLNKIILESNYDQLREINDNYFHMGLSNESIKVFISKDLLRTPMLYMLKNNLFDDLINLGISCRSRFDYFNDNNKFPSLFECIIEFKKYILLHTTVDVFDYLFTEPKYIEKYPFEYNNEVIENINLFVKIFKNDVDLIKYYMLNNKDIINEEKLLLFLDCFNKYCDIKSIVDTEIVENILINFAMLSKLISKTNDIFEKIIDKMPENIRYKTAIQYQVTCDKLIRKYYLRFDNIEEEDIKFFCDFLNEIDEDRVSFEVISKINVFYPFKEHIIKLYLSNGYFSKALASALLINNKSLIENTLSKIHVDNLVKLYENDRFTKLLLKNENFIKKINVNKMINIINVKDIVEVLRQDGFTYKLLNTYLTYLTEEKIVELLLSLENMSYDESKVLINVISPKKQIVNLIVKNNKLYRHLFSNIDYNFRSRFGREIKNRDYIVVND